MSSHVQELFHENAQVEFLLHVTFTCTHLTRHPYASSVDLRFKKTLNHPSLEHIVKLVTARKETTQVGGF